MRWISGSSALMVQGVLAGGGAHVLEGCSSALGVRPQRPQGCAGGRAARSGAEGRSPGKISLAKEPAMRS
eukprot:1769762-Pyramimonas_sp.AAC.1